MSKPNIKKALSEAVAVIYFDDSSDYSAALLEKTKKCESCGKIFVLNKMANHTRWCPSCRPLEYIKIKIENNHGIYRRGRSGPRGQTLAEQETKKYMTFVLNKIIKTCELRKKHKPMLDMRQSGMTYTKIAEKFNCSSSNAQNICTKYSADKSINLISKSQRRLSLCYTSKE